MALRDPQITAARVRAALAYEGIVIRTQGEKRTGIKLSTLNRIIAKTNPRAASTDELRLIADACPSVPAWFFEFGFAPPVETGEADLRQELADLTAKFQTLAAMVARQGEEQRAGRGPGRRKARPANDAPTSERPRTEPPRP